MEKPIRVTCAIIVHKGRVLAAQRSEKMHLSLKWEFPGGKVESSENEEECLIREVKEELNLDIDVLEKLSPNVHQYPKKKKIVLIPFLCHYKGGELSLKEHKSAAWLSPSELLNLDWAEADIPIVEEFIKLFRDSLS
ncbi:(deoxy)nucleoside triphosphate pyrophosphohydrolase [Arthrospiribacter ruber]|uniref:8-oxo-dGTP diphosphatase n=1 Tax=Arthrospiribacter ruber TaxID=2487934 RepID=A0A951IW90_9BACT|nr:(deoxy)nucleoside triphosphate pyrophosphohydrolase [Arthrospiribacter ruber]MBW3467222.1 (deoxy)nucleoside triphosphate pyrophosphohydrolase [Arthrospiribacter ruber]